MLKFLEEEITRFNSLYKNKYFIVPNFIPIFWFCNVEKYFCSQSKIITVSLNPLDIEFKIKDSDEPSTKFRFPNYDGSIKTFYIAYNNYFIKNLYPKWFNTSFRDVLKSFNASYYEEEGFPNIALHTYIACPYATNPTWSGLVNDVKADLENMGIKTWHKLVSTLEPDLILFSSSIDFEKKIQKINLENKVAPLLESKVKVSENKEAVVIFRIKGRTLFSRIKKEQKLKLKKYVYENST